MQAIQPYLFFNGNCRDAMGFYAQALNAKLDLMTYGQGPQCPQGGADLIMHAQLSGPDGCVVMASDAPPGQPLPEGQNFSLSVACNSRDEQEHIFATLSMGGAVTQPLQDTFWGAHFGMLRDRFGVSWMLSHQEPQAQQGSEG